MDRSPELFAILQGDIAARRERELQLEGKTQQGSKAFSLENTISSDAISASNLFNGDSLSTADITTGIEVNQLNELQQRHRQQGSLELSLPGPAFEQTIQRRTGSESYDYLVYSSIYQQRRSLLQRTDFASVTADVGDRYTSLQQFTSAILPLEVVSWNAFPRIFDFPEVGGTLDAGWFGKYGATLDYTGIGFTGTGLRIDTISARGADLILGTTLTAPKIDFGAFDIKACAGACTQSHWDLGSLNLTFINIAPSELTLPGMAPEIQELNVGSGFAFGGSSQLITTPGLFTIEGEAFLKVTPYANLTLDLSKLQLLGVDVGKVIKDLKVFTDENGNGINKLSHAWSFDLINAEIDFDVLRENLEIPSIVLAPDDVQHITDEIVTTDNDTIEIYKTNDTATSNLNEYYAHTRFSGGQVSGAAAELLALSEGTLTVDNSSTISLSASAQQNMRIINAVNAASSVAANALNMSRPAALTSGASAVTHTTMQQHNLFLQQR